MMGQRFFSARGAPGRQTMTDRNERGSKTTRVRRVLVPVANPNTARDLIRLAGRLGVSGLFLFLLLGLVLGSTFPALDLQDAELAYGLHPLLDRANLTVLDGERIGLIGRNGTGKSSLLRGIAGSGEHRDRGIVQQAEILHRQQMLGLEMLTARGVLTKINSVLIPGINDEHLVEVNREVKKRGAFLHNIMPLISEHLGAESIDFLDIVFRLEKSFSIKIPRGELFPDDLLNNPDYVSNGKFTPVGLQQMRKAMPHADFSSFESDPDVTKMPDLFTVKTLVNYIESKLAA